MADRTYPWTEFPDEPEDYLWDCIETEITEYPNLFHFDNGTDFMSISRIKFGGISDVNADRSFAANHVITWNALSDIDLCDPNDDFTGIDGSAPDSDRWIESDPFNNMSIQSNKLNYNSGGIVGEEQLSKITLTANLAGNFDIQIDYDITTMTAPSTLFTYAARIDVLNSVSEFIGQIIRGRGPVTSVYAYNGEDVGFTSIDSTDLLGKLRITRENGVVRVFYWSGSQWEWNGNIAGVIVANNNNEILTVVLFIGARPGTNLNSNIDNFVINSADQIICA